MRIIEYIKEEDYIKPTYLYSGNKQTLEPIINTFKSSPKTFSEVYDQLPLPLKKKINREKYVFKPGRMIDFVACKD